MGIKQWKEEGLVLSHDFEIFSMMGGCSRTELLKSWPMEAHLSEISDQEEIQLPKNCLRLSISSNQSLPKKTLPFLNMSNVKVH